MFKSYFSLITVSSHFYPVNLFLEHGRQFPMEFYQLLYSFIFKYDNWRQYVLCTQQEKTHSILVLFTARCFYCDWPRTFVSHSSIQWDIESKKNLIDIANLIKSCVQSCSHLVHNPGASLFLISAGFFVTKQGFQQNLWCMHQPMSFFYRW